MAQTSQLQFLDEPASTIHTSRSVKRPAFFATLPVFLCEDPVLELLLRTKQDCFAVPVADLVSLDDIIARKLPVNYPNRATLGGEFTDDDYRLLCQKLETQHHRFQEHQIRDIRRKVDRFKTTFSHLTVEEIFTALAELEYNEDEAALHLTKPDYITQLRRTIARAHSVSITRAKGPVKRERVTTGPVVSVATKSPSSPPSAHQSDAEAFESDETVADSDDEASDESDSPVRARHRGTGTTVGAKTVKRMGRLRLDEALAKVSTASDPEVAMEGWSEARVRAYKMMRQNPNAYYYRFNAPGEMQRNGAWSREEHQLFVERLAEVGADGQWGIFSIVIPGRVGYQCSNYYRKLIESGQLQDASYVVDAQGKAHYVTGKTRTGSSERTETVVTKRKHASLRDDDSNSEGDRAIPTRKRAARRAIQESQDLAHSPRRSETVLPIANNSPRSPFYENPLPGFIDAITRMEVTRPAISPYGHVLSYDTWLKCLLNSDRKNVCPLTNRPLQKRQLIFLTAGNIDMYRDQIINMCAEERGEAITGMTTAVRHEQTDL